MKERFFLHAAATLAYLQLWQRLCVLDGQCSDTADFFEPQLGKYNILEAMKQILV